MVLSLCTNGKYRGEKIICLFLTNCQSRDWLRRRTVEISFCTFLKMKKRHKSKAAQLAAERDVELYVRLLVLFIVNEILHLILVLFVENSTIKSL